MTGLTRYDGWHTVPEHLRTKTQLADLDLPRVPGGEAAGYVHDRGPHGRKGEFDLYDLGASLPSPATAGQLQAARERSESDGRRCAACGARPDQRPTAHRGPGGGAVQLLCHPCLHIARLREAQHRIATERAEACAQAAIWLAQDTTALVHAAPITPPPGADGRPKHPLALTVGAFTPAGTLLYRSTVRLNRSRNPIVPADAIAAGEALEALRAKLTGRCVIEWSAGALKHLGGLLTFPDEPARSALGLFVLDRRVAAWRGQIDPHTYRLTTPPDPGRADLMALLIRRMAADHTTPDPE